MAQQLINTGAAPDDGTGDQLRTAADKINDNFTELYAGQILQITTNTTFYVRTDGNDSNDGLSNTPGGAWLTLQYAMDWVASHCIVWSPAAVTIQIGNGTYSAGTLYPPRFAGSGKVILQGDVATPSNVVITSASSFTFEFRAATYYRLQGFTLTGVSHLLRCIGTAYVEINALRFGATAGGAHILCNGGGVVSIEGNYSIVGGATAHWQIDTGGSLRMFSLTCTVTGTPAFTNGFCYALIGGNVYTASNTFTGAATGPRFQVILNGAVVVSGAGVNVFPGSVAGTVATGGVYG